MSDSSLCLPERFALVVRNVVLCVVLFYCLSVRMAAAADPPEGDAPPEGDEAAPSSELTETWTVLWDARHAPWQPANLPDDSPLVSLVGFELKGIPTADRFQLGHVKCVGRWGSKKKHLVRMNGRDSALKLPRGEDLEMEGVFTADGLGGWFILFGWDKGHGYGIYSVTLKQSGSVWYLAEYRDASAIEATHYKISEFAWKGALPLYFDVTEKKLSLKVGREKIADEIELPNYHAGHVIIGTYDTPYGPKNVAVRSLRMRAK